MKSADISSIASLHKKRTEGKLKRVKERKKEKEAAATESHKPYLTARVRYEITHLELGVVD